MDIGLKLTPTLSFQRKLESQISNRGVCRNGEIPDQVWDDSERGVGIKFQYFFLSHGERIEVRGFDVETVDLKIETGYPLTALPAHLSP